MHPKKISIADYSYHLPEEFIAHYPLAERDASKLLVYREGGISEDLYRHIADHLPANSLLVFNNTKVVEARILFRKPTGAQIELFCLEPPPEYAGITAAMQQQGTVRWKCLIGGASKWKSGQVLTRTIERQGEAGQNEPVTLEARYISKGEDFFLIELSWEPAHLSFAALLHQAGLIPLPPYIHRAAEESDSERYQTIYALHDGSVAAPTAGLHFTETIFQTLAAKNIRREFVTLHVGAGTFLPVKAATMEQHVMHVEYISVTPATIKKLLGSLGDTIIPVGTTSARTIESLYWLGVKTFRDPAILPEDLSVQQWDAYQEDNAISPEKALTALLNWMEKQGLPQLLSKTQLLITPGYDWKIIRGLITNFHQPESTLLLLVASLIGKDWRKVYNYALEHQFRFLSYGDGCLLLR
ncbi:MAG TPA: S-adenosylmethionine:tRNA ribosyltransferase-isomerase [Puia sp.]|jgi:S-adenosylmethionine:tRNA ribosyltransferase-isomerase|nr:S-adenosylmethionine:tRNA ribosyltransferase-isomerase [Puia sp.]